jgi:hypothetical protein
MVRRTIGLLLVLAVLALARPLSAAPSWVDRPSTLPRLVFAGDAGFGIAHQRFRNDPATGAGLNLEAALGVTDRFELGLRTGVRFGPDGKALNADAYGRTLWTETYGTNQDSVANPELRLRWAAYRGRVVEVALDGRFYMPIEQGSRAGVMFGVPLAFHIADFMRIDTGLYVPVIFADEIGTVISVPGYFWFQVSNRVWLGPMIGLRHVDPGGPNNSRNDLLLGFGVGYQVASAVDLKWMLLFPNANTDDGRPRTWGAGFGLQFRIGE